MLAFYGDFRHFLYKMNECVMLNIDVVGAGDSALLDIFRNTMDRREKLQTIKADFWEFNFKLGQFLRY